MGNATVVGCHGNALDLQGASAAGSGSCAIAGTAGPPRETMQARVGRKPAGQVSGKLWQARRVFGVSFNSGHGIESLGLRCALGFL
jgi:hypothetical protein